MASVVLPKLKNYKANFCEIGACLQFVFLHLILNYAMKFKTVFRLIAAFILLSPTFAKAQILEPVTWNFTTEKLADDRYNLVFTADIEPKWHLYSQNIPMSPPATTFSFSDNESVEFIGKVTEQNQ